MLSVGWKHEFELLGVPYADRGAIFDEHLDAMRALWTQDEPAYAGRHVALSDLVFAPSLRAGGHTSRCGSPAGAGRRSASSGSGARATAGCRWASDVAFEALRRDGGARIKAGAAERGRNPDALTFRYTFGIGEAEPALGGLSTAIAAAKGGIAARDAARTAIFGGSPDEVAGSIARYAEAGFTELAINPAGGSYDECMDRIEWFAAEVLPLTGSPARATPP